tara:strand:- start:449 stop:667 length:219 start_codon:yes stop_codon:yes gene_type:complete
MIEKIKKILVLLSLSLTIIYGIVDIAYGVYFGVLTNVLINAFWNSHLFKNINKIKKKTDQELILESIGPPRL